MGLTFGPCYAGARLSPDPEPHRWPTLCTCSTLLRHASSCLCTSCAVERLICLSSLLHIGLRVRASLRLVLR